MKRLALLLACLGVWLSAGPVWAQQTDYNPSTPQNAIVSGGSGYTNQPNTAQSNANILSPFNAPYLVVPTTGTVSANSQTSAVRLRNMQQLNQFFADVAVTSPGALISLGSFPIEVCVRPSDQTLTNQNVYSTDFRNTTSKSGVKLIAERNAARIYAFDCNDNTKPVQAAIVLIGGRAQDMTLTAQSFLAPTIDPVVSHATATFNAGQMTITAPLKNSGAAVSASANGSVIAGQYVVRAPGTSSTIPINCPVLSQASGNTSLDGVYNLGGDCASYTNAVGQTVYLGQAAEVADNGMDGNIGFSVFCPTQGEYDLYATKVATGFALPPVNASTYGSCGSGNNSFSVNWKNLRADAVSYRMWDFQGWNAGSSGDFFGSMYFGNGGADLNVCGVENKYYMNGEIRNCESASIAKVESADYLNPNTANTGGQSNISPVADWYQVGGNTQDHVGTFHFESNTYNCTGGFGSDNGALEYHGSGTSVTTHYLQAISTTLTGCTHFAIHRIFGTDVHMMDDIVQDGGTSGGSGSWVLNGAVVAYATSNNSSITRGTADVGEVQVQNSPGGITLQTYNLATADTPVLKTYAGNQIAPFTVPQTITDATANDGAGLTFNPATLTSGTIGFGVNVQGTLNTASNVVGAVLNANITNTACGSCTLISLQSGSGGTTNALSLTPAGTLTAGFSINAGTSGTLGWTSGGLMSSPATNSVTIGPAPAASQSAQTLATANIVAGTSNTAGVNLTLAAGKGTGTGAGGSLILGTAPAGSTGTASNALATAMTIDSTGKTTLTPQANATGLVITAPTMTSGTVPFGVSVTGTLNTASNVDGAVLFANVTNTACGTCQLLDLQVASSSVFSVAPSGTTTIAGSMTMGNTRNVCWAGRGCLSSNTTGNTQLGVADAAAPVAQTVTTQNVVAGTSNTAGVNTTFAASQGTGTGVGGSLIFQTAPAGSTGTAQNAEVTLLTLDATSHLVTGGSAPTCGTGCSAVVGTDTAFKVTTGTTVTSIAVNFAKTWGAAPVCVASDNSTATTLDISSITTTAITFTTAAAVTSATIWAHCLQ